MADRRRERSDEKEVSPSQVPLPDDEEVPGPSEDQDDRDAEKRKSEEDDVSESGRELFVLKMLDKIVSGDDRGRVDRDNYFARALEIQDGALDYVSRQMQELKRAIRDRIKPFLELVVEQQCIIRTLRSHLDLVEINHKTLKETERLSRSYTEEETGRKMYSEVLKTKATKFQGTIKEKRQPSRSRSRSKSRVNLVTIYPKTDKEMSSDDTRKRIEEKFDIKKLKAGVMNVKKIRNGGILIQLEDKGDADQFIDGVNNNVELKENFCAGTPKRREPHFIMFNVQEDLDNEEIVRSMREQNNCFEEINIKSKFKGRSGNNIVFSINPKSYNEVIKIKKVKIGWARVDMKEHLRPTICYKCGKYGHIGKVCRSDSICLKCGERNGRDHECRTIKCNNCIIFNNKFHTKYPVDHSCTDKNCRILHKEVDRLSSRTDYG